MGADARAAAKIAQKSEGVVAGLDVARAVFAAVDPALRFEPSAEEGVWRDGGPVARVEGAARPILAGERTALNFLGRLSGIATLDRPLRSRGGGNRRPDTRHA